MTEKEVYELLIQIKTKVSHLLDEEESMALTHAIAMVENE